MSAAAEFDPRHPHERDGRDEKPVLDKDGRCLACCRDTMIRLESDNAALRAERDKLVKRLMEEESAHEDTIRHRDFCEHWADKLANAVAGVEVIGEHSNLNSPWEQAHSVMRSLDEFLAVENQRDELRSELKALESDNAALKSANNELRGELAEMKASFKLRWNASQRGFKKWHAANPGNELTWPDHADLVCFLLEQNVDLLKLVDDAESERDAARSDLAALRQRFAQAVEALRKFGTHRMKCRAFPAKDDEQIARDCDCGLQDSLSTNGSSK